MAKLLNIAISLFWWGTKNRGRRQLQRMRQPRHFLGVMVALGYLLLVFGRRAFTPGVRQSLPVNAVSLIEAALVASALFSLFAAWFFGSERPTLNFTGAEVQFLFPAPITRRMLLQYKLLKSLFGTFLSAAVSTAFFGGMAAGHWLEFLLGSWLAFFTLTLHLTLATLIRAGLVQQGKPGWRRRWPVIPAAAAVIGAFVWSALRAPTLPPMSEWNADALSRWVTAFMDAPPLSWVLFPIRAPIHVAFARNARDLLVSLVPALLVAAVHYFGVLSTQVSFEEASLEFAEERARRAEARRSSAGLVPVAPGKRKPSFPLSSRGHPEIALVWKNVIAFLRGGSRPTLMAMVVVTVMFVPIVLKRSASGLWLGGICLMLAFFATLLGPDTLRVDLRQDIRHLDLLRTFPLRGRSILLGEVLGPTLMLSAIQLALLVASVAVSARYPLRDFGLRERIAVLAALAFFLPSLTFLNVLARNAAVLILPSWMADPDQTRGLEMLGQRLLMWIANLVVMAVAVLPSCFVGAVVWFVLWRPFGLLAAPLAGAIASGVMVFELWVGLELLGKMFDSLDLAA